MSKPTVQSLQETLKDVAEQRDIALHNLEEFKARAAAELAKYKLEAEQELSNAKALWEQTSVRTRNTLGLVFFVLGAAVTFVAMKILG